jgi:hypothetical protein
MTDLGQEPAAPDPANDGAKVYNTLARFNMNYGNITPGGEQTYDAITYDLVRQPDNLLAIKGNILGMERIVHVGGYTYGFFVGESNATVGVVRQDGAIWRPMVQWMRTYVNDGPGWVNGTKGIGNQASGCNFSNGQGCLWIDSNADGEPAASEMSATPGGYYLISWDMDANGDVWSVSETGGISRWRHAAPNASGIMSYSRSAIVNYGKPSIFSTVERTLYDPSNDRLFVSGWSTAQPNPGTEDNGVDTVAGNLLARYDNFKATGHFPTATWTTALPYYNVNTSHSTVNGVAPGQPAGCNVYLPISSGGCTGNQFVYDIQQAGSYVFGDVGHIWGQNANPITAAKFWIKAWNISDGSLAGNVFPGPGVNYWSGNWNDTHPGFVALQRQSDGQYLIFNQNEMNGGTNLYRGLLRNFSQY